MKKGIGISADHMYID